MATRKRKTSTRRKPKTTAARRRTAAAIALSRRRAAAARRRRLTAASLRAKRLRAKRLRKLTGNLKKSTKRLGLTAVALAKVGTRKASNAGRGVLARGARSAAGGLQRAARDVGDSGASALRTVASKVAPPGQP